MKSKDLTQGATNLMQPIMTKSIENIYPVDNFLSLPKIVVTPNLKRTRLNMWPGVEHFFIHWAEWNLGTGQWSFQKIVCRNWDERKKEVQLKLQTNISVFRMLTSITHDLMHKRSSTSMKEYITKNITNILIELLWSNDKHLTFAQNGQISSIHFPVFKKCNCW